MRADRLLSILLVLQTQDRVTANELATRLEVSERTIYRDMEALSAVGVPVVAERGANGGWYLLEAYKTNLTGLNLAEAQALFVSPPAQLLGDLGLQQSADAATLKLLATLPTAQRKNAEAIRQRIHIDGSGWHHSSDSVACLPILQEAIWLEYELELTYQLSGGDVVEIEVAPLGLVAKGSVWYFVGLAKQNLRTYRVSRIQAAEISNRPFVRPASFDLAAFWAESSAKFIAALPRYPVLVRVAPASLSLLRYLIRTSRITVIESRTGDDWQTLQIEFDTEEEACTVLLGFGPHLEVVDPVSLRHQIVARAKSTITFYGQSEIAA